MSLLIASTILMAQILLLAGLVAEIQPLRPEVHAVRREHRFLAIKFLEPLDPPYCAAAPLSDFLVATYSFADRWLAE